MYSCYCTFAMSKVICTCLSLLAILRLYLYSNYTGSGEHKQTIMFSHVTNSWKDYN